MRLVVVSMSRIKVEDFFPQSEGVEFVEPTEEELEVVQRETRGKDKDWKKNVHIIKCKPKLMARMLFLMLVEGFPSRNLFELF